MQIMRVVFYLQMQGSTTKIVGKSKWDKPLPKLRELFYFWGKTYRVKSITEETDYFLVKCTNVEVTKL